MKALERIDRLSWRMGVSVALLVMGGQAAAFTIVYRYYYQELLSSTREHAHLETQLIRKALEHQMIEKHGRVDRDDRLVGGMVSGFAGDHAVDRVLIFDRQGAVAFSSDPSYSEDHFQPSSSACVVCHRYSPEQRPQSVMLSLDGGRVLRCVQPIPNQPACYGCHPREHRINGLVMVDVPIEAALRGLQRSVASIALGTGLLGLALLAGIGLVVRRLVLRRLFRFHSTARAIAGGELERRVEIEGNDALTEVEQEFNHMADSVTSLLAQVRRQRANLERVMNSVDDGLVVLDRQRVIVAANDAFLRRFAASGSQLVGGPCCGKAGEGLAGCDPSGGACPAGNCFAHGSVEMAIRTRTLPDGSSRQEEVRASPIVGEGGAVDYVVEVWRDITDRRSAEAKLADYQRMVSLGMLASGFSHEVNTPLASVATCLDGITRLCDEAVAVRGKQKELVLEYARIAATQVSRCGAITEHFLQLARGRSIEHDIVDLGAAAEGIARLCQPQARESGATLQIVRDGPVPAVSANGAAVQQVLLNLVLNALEACGREPRVRISFAVGERVEMRVTDNGRGIPPEDVARLFEPFFTRRAKGTGLGLFVSMNLARSWGGDIEVESEVGAGTTFTVVFPRAASEGA